MGARGVDFLEFIRGESSQYSSNVGHDRFPSRTSCRFAQMLGLHCYRTAQLLEVQR